MLNANNDFIILNQYITSDTDFVQVPGEVSEMKYKVISVGNKVENIKVDDIVVCYAEPPIKIDGVDYWYTKEDAIIAKVNS